MVENVENKGYLSLEQSFADRATDHLLTSEKFNQLKLKDKNSIIEQVVKLASTKDLNGLDELLKSYPSTQVKKKFTPGVTQTAIAPDKNTEKQIIVEEEALIKTLSAEDKLKQRIKEAEKNSKKNPTKIPKSAFSKKTQDELKPNSEKALEFLKNKFSKIVPKPNVASKNNQTSRSTNLDRGRGR